jgi:hypothetical protein
LDIDIAAIGYPDVRKAFNDCLQLCVEKVSKSEWQLARDILDFDALDEDMPGAIDMLTDTALYSRKDIFGERAGAQRAIDRIAPKLPLKRQPLMSAIAARLPKATFSVFAVTHAPGQDRALARDMLAEGRRLTIMDQSLSAQLAGRGEMLIAGRFVDLGPWHIGFGIVQSLRKSEALAISLALSGEDEPAAGCDTLHELLYPVHLHGGNLVMAALEPLIETLALAVDSELIDMNDLTASLGPLLTDKRPPKRNRKTDA